MFVTILPEKQADPAEVRTLQAGLFKRSTTPAVSFPFGDPRVAHEETVIVLVPASLLSARGQSSYNSGTPDGYDF
jgi:hypothetical protein